MRVLITGGAGFIGSALARAYLDRGASVTVVDSLITGRQDQVPAGAAMLQLDVRDAALPDVFAEHGPFDVVSHHAALKDVRRALVDPRSDADANILGTLNVLRSAAEHHAGLFVYPSSAAVYGDAVVRPTPEAAPVAPNSPYGISKAAGEAYCGFFARNRRLPAVALRYSTVYGPAAREETEAGVITRFTRRMLGGQRPTIFGDGQQTRDLIYIDDIVRANLAATDAPRAAWAVYNVSTGVETTINDVSRLLAKEIGFPDLPEYEPAKPGEVRLNCQDPSLMYLELGWQAQVPLIDGLRRVVAAHRAEEAAFAR
jgi:UDP-glucose 4-epimerase